MTEIPQHTNPSRAEITLQAVLKIALAAYIMCLPLSPRISNYTLIALGVLALGLAIVSRQKVKPLSPAFYFLAAAYVVRVISIFHAENFPNAALALEIESTMVAIPLVFSLLPQTRTFVRISVWGFAAMCFLTMVYAFVQLGIYLNTTSPWSFAEYSYFHFHPKWFWINTRYFAQNMLTWDYAHYSFLSLMVIYGIHLIYALDAKTKVEKIFLVIYSLITFLFIVYTGSRIGMIVLICLALTYAFLAKSDLLFRYWRAGLVLIVGSIVGAIVLFLSIGKSLDYVRHHFQWMAVKAFLEKPFFGYGTASGKELMRDPAFEEQIGYTVNHPHNQFLSELLQFGVLGSIPFFLFIAALFKQSLHQRNTALLALMISCVLLMLTESPLASNKGSMPMFTALCITFSISLVSHKRKQV
ncbi:MAG TPA: O-antigen ligase family protein [Chryseosolibacter sp.]